MCEHIILNILVASIQSAHMDHDKEMRIITKYLPVHAVALKKATSSRWEIEFLEINNNAAPFRRKKQNTE